MNLNPDLALNVRAAQLFVDFQSAGVSSTQLPRNTITFREIIGVFLQNEVLDKKGGFSDEEINVMLRKNGFRPPSKKYLHSIMNGFGFVYGNNQSKYPHIPTSPSYWWLY